MDFDYVSLAALAAVIREGSFDEAAKSLSVTQSAVSQRIKQLEERIGSVLVVRGRPCVPTEAGLQLCQHVQQVTLLEHELSERMSELSGAGGALTATIRISANNDSLATWFPDVIKRAGNELNVRFDIISDDQEHTEQRLKTGEALAVITAIEKPVQGCRRVSLGAMDYISVASPEFYEANFPKGVSVESLSDTVCIAFDRKDTIQDQFLISCFGETVPLSTHMVPSYEGYLACCLNGTGWGLVPELSARPLIKRGELIELIPGKVVRVSLHWQASVQSSELLRRLGDLVLDVAREKLIPDGFRVEQEDA